MSTTKIRKNTCKVISKPNIAILGTLTTVLPLRLLVIDPAMSSGYAVFAWNGASIVSIEAYGDMAIEGVTNGHQCIAMMESVSELIKTHRPNRVLVEDYFFRGRTANGSTMNVALRAATWMACTTCNVEYSTVPPITWKKFIVGRSKPSVSENTMWGAHADKIIVQHALWRLFSIRFPNHSISHKTQKPVKMRYDAVDAVAMGIWYYSVNSLSAPITQWTNTVAISLDVPHIDSSYTY